MGTMRDMDRVQESGRCVRRENGKGGKGERKRWKRSKGDDESGVDTPLSFSLFPPFPFFLLTPL
jgi:hypothetical protein